MKIASAVLIAAGLVMYPADVQAQGRSLNLLAAINLPADQQDLFTRQTAEALATSRVPTAKEAAQLALDVIARGPGLEAREGYRVSGLYLMGRDVTGFASRGDLFWEVQISFLEGVSRVLWVSTSTKAVKMVFP